MLCRHTKRQRNRCVRWYAPFEARNCLNIPFGIRRSVTRFCYMKGVIAAI